MSQTGAMREGCCHPCISRLLIHYDIAAGDRRNRVRVVRYLFGDEVRVRRKGTARVYTYEGAVHRPGVRWIGQSVVMMSASEAERFLEKLHTWGVRHTKLSVHLA